MDGLPDVREWRKMPCTNNAMEKKDTVVHDITTEDTVVDRHNNQRCCE
jgi:hypothetical protein